MLLAQKSSILFTIGLVMVIFLAFSVFALIWTNYTQWVFDEFVNDTVKGAKKYRGMSKQTASETTEFIYMKNAVSTRKVKPITDYDIEIATLPESYSRADLLRLQESKDKMIEDSARYEEEHKDLVKEELVDEILEAEDEGYWYPGLKRTMIVSDYDLDRLEMVVSKLNDLGYDTFQSQWNPVSKELIVVLTASLPRQ
jgi:hypothetical protein